MINALVDFVIQLLGAILSDVPYLFTSLFAGGLAGLGVGWFFSLGPGLVTGGLVFLVTLIGCNVAARGKA
ncbi:MAG: hypothetical protein J0H01_21230 [Rhizobiales bacterium]|nr:hypothetical protein [Hyphomicrobiales bacterium]